MNNIKNMSKREFSLLPTYNKDAIQVGQTYRFFSDSVSDNELKTCYVKTIYEKDGGIKQKIFEVKITD